MTRKPSRSFAVLALAAVLGAACQGTSTTSAPLSAEVRDIEPVLDGEPVFTTGANGLVTMQVSTTIDVGCNIVFGPDTAYGTLATDADMSDGAHHDHTVILGTLSPGAVVHYSLQGADPTGQLYQGGDRTFVVPDPGSATLRVEAPRGDAEGRTNLALGRDVTAVSSEFNANFGVSNAVDGNPATEWSTRGDGDDAYLTVDLGEVVDVTGVGFWTRDMADGTAVITSVRVLVDDSDLGTFDVGPDLTVIDLEATGRFVTFEAATSTGGNTGAVEVEVYGP